MFSRVLGRPFAFVTEQRKFRQTTRVVYSAQHRIIADQICRAHPHRPANPVTGRKMVTADDIKKRLQVILEEADLNVVTERKVTAQLGEEFGKDVEKFKDVIKKGIQDLWVLLHTTCSDSCMHSHMPLHC